MSDKAPQKIRFWRALGPGLTSGAADDDPSGIATYSVAGAQFGTALLWTAWLTWPLMACVQMMCARIGMVTGMGLAGALRQKFPKWLLIVFSIALILANTINIAADLAGMGDAVEMLGGGPSQFYEAVFGFGICYATVQLRYHQIASILKWFALALFAYVATAFIARPDWSAVLRTMLVPQLPAGSWLTLVAILGTTISPYLFFWQAGQEVEEEKAMGRRLLAARRGATMTEIVGRRIDIGIGAFFSNIVMFFIILTTAATLHRSGLTEIATTRQAAEALRPLAGDFAYLLYTIGVVGTGLLAIPTLAGSAAYALAETFEWELGLDNRFRQATAFYCVFIVATLVAVAIDFVGVDPIKSLYWSAVINGALAPFLLVCILIVASDRTIMLGQPSSIGARSVVAVAIVFMFVAGFATLAQAPSP
jgi:NRAMP (natural resistance-associated macrophage protein)-like metal ion transporter